MRTIKKFEGYYAGQLCYEWEVKQDDNKLFHFFINGCTNGKHATISMAMYDMWSSMKDFMTYENANKIEIKGC